MRTLFTNNDEVHGYNTRNSEMPHLFTMRSTPYSQSFLYNSIKLKFKLKREKKLDIFNCNSMGLFVKNLKKYLLDQ